MHAASEGQLIIVKLLIDNGADASLKDIDTAEDFARLNKHNFVVEYLSNYTKGKK